MMFRLLMLLSAFSLLPMGAYAGDYFFEYSVKGIIDLRAVNTDGTRSWMDGGPGKTRYGGTRQGDSRSTGQLAEAALVLSSRINWSLTGHLSLKYDPDQKHVFDVLEGFIAYRPVTTSSWRLKTRMGIFSPPVSMEHRGVAWTSPYSITPSAINTWIGEEVRTLGAEFTLMHEDEDNQLSLTGAVFKGNDPAGSLLAYRGWAMHDRKSGLNDRFPLAPIASIQPGQPFEVQAPWVEPFDELDGNWGYYMGVQWDRPGTSRLRILYYDNRADESAFDGDQYAWHTRFASVGASFELDEKLEILTQFMSGNTRMGPVSAGINPVDIDFSAFYILASKRVKKHRVTLRYDRFKISDEDQGVLVPTDLNQEDGNAWTLAYAFKLEKKQQFIFEILRVNSDRPARGLIDLPSRIVETQVQVSYRLLL